MRLLADLHAHTIASRDAYSGDHASATRDELAAAAAARGLELIAVTDHGPACPGAAPLSAVAESASAERYLNGVLVLSGIEADPVPYTANGLDVPDDILETLDFVAVAFHPVTGWGEEHGDSAVITSVLVDVMSNPLVDMIAHPGNEWFPVDIDEVVAAAVANDVIVEFNAHTFKPGSVRESSADRELAFLAAALEAGARIAIDSDAHHAADIGDIEAGLAAAAGLDLSAARVVNRDAASVIEFLLAKRPRPALEALIAKRPSLGASR